MSVSYQHAMLKNICWKPLPICLQREASEIWLKGEGEEGGGEGRGETGGGR